MNELEPKQKTEISQDQQQKQEYKLVGWENLSKGCHLYSYDPSSKVFQKVELSPITEAKLLNHRKEKLTLGHIVHRVPVKTDANYKAQLDPKCIYAIAINHKNAARKINKILKQYGIDQRIVIKK